MSQIVKIAESGRSCSPFQKITGTFTNLQIPAYYSTSKNNRQEENLKKGSQNGQIGF